MPGNFQRGTEPKTERIRSNLEAGFLILSHHFRADRQCQSPTAGKDGCLHLGRGLWIAESWPRWRQWWTGRGGWGRGCKWRLLHTDHWDVQPSSPARPSQGIRCILFTQKTGWVFTGDLSSPPERKHSNPRQSLSHVTQCRLPLDPPVQSFQMF